MTTNSNCAGLESVVELAKKHWTLNASNNTSTKRKALDLKATPNKKAKGKKGTVADVGNEDGNQSSDDIVESIWRDHLQPSNSSPAKVAYLEFSQYFEQYLWPNLDVEAATTNYILSIVLILNEKCREIRLSDISLLTSDAEKYIGFFKRVLSLLVDDDSGVDSLKDRESLLTYLINAFQSLENHVIRKECMRLVTISIWHCLQPERLELELARSTKVRKAWNKAEKKRDGIDEATKSRLGFDQCFFSRLIVNYFELLESIDTNAPFDDAIRYCERFLELIADLEAQLPTRRFLSVLVDDHLLIIISKGCQLGAVPSGQRFKEMLAQLIQFANVDLDEEGKSLSATESLHLHYERIQQLQKLCFLKYKEYFEDISLSSIAVIHEQNKFPTYWKKVDASILRNLCKDIGIRTEKPGREHGSGSDLPDEILMQAIIDMYSKTTSLLEEVNFMSLFPTEAILDDDSLLSDDSYDGLRGLPIPKLNLQFLTFTDYLLRNFKLYQLENYYQIRQDVEDAFDVVDIGTPLLGSKRPRHVKANLAVNIGHYSEGIRREWEAIRQHDALFLVTLQAEPELPAWAQNGNAQKKPQTTKERLCVKYLRGCEVEQVFDGQSDGDGDAQEDRGRGGSLRRMRVLLDPNQYYDDTKGSQAKKGEELYASFNILLRRKPQENNFKTVLECIRDIMQSDVVVPEFLHDLILGYGDPVDAHYSKLEDDEKSIDFKDAFLSLEHIKTSFSQKVLIDGVDPNSKTNNYILSSNFAEQGEIRVTSYKPEKRGPYPQNAYRANTVEFTPHQVSSILSGTLKGLTLIVGPPGTGKTDVAVQILAQLYKNYPTQKTLLITHSNQALNNLFEKISKLDIDPRHLLRLGHGTDELDLDGDWGKLGRVQLFLEKRVYLLQEVDRLSYSLNIPGSYGSSCETAGHFYAYFIASKIVQYKKMLSETKDKKAVVEMFPFYAFFLNAPQPLFSEGIDLLGAIETAQSCLRYVEDIFTTLEEIRAFELLRTNYDRSNYLLLKEARIVALTCTHAALKRKELVSMGFKYHNVIMEEAGQMLEVETVIPLLLQSSGELERAIMIGDHNQLPPVVKNNALKKYAHLDQSLFSRLIRLDVPAIQLDMQGRSRPDIADLFRWRYENLGDLPAVVNNPRYKISNPGFCFDYQLVNVDDYNGNGETEPLPHFYQNLGEAEYVVAVFQYMRLIGYPAERISILTTYNGQKALIDDVLERRCRWNPLFGLPKHVSTVDKFQGQQNDYILLSLVRTKNVGHLRDVRRLIVSASRARLGLYVFCRAKLFESCHELKPVFNRLNSRPSNSLWLYGNEVWGEGHKRALDVSGVKQSNDDATVWKPIEEANFYAFSARVLNTRGQTIYDRLNALLGILFTMVMIIYAGFRGHRVVTQLPATFRTTRSPGQLPIEFVQTLFPNNIPSATYEFPAVTMCADDPAATVTLVSCNKVSTASTLRCDNAGVSARNITFMGETLNCVTVNGALGQIFEAENVSDVLSISLTVRGTRVLKSNGVLAQLHDNNSTIDKLSVEYENMFAASAFALTHVVARKVLEIDLSNNYQTAYESKASQMMLNVPSNNVEDAPITIEIKYPKLEVLYQKEFLPLDMNNWLGEVGGVAALLMFLQRTLIFFVSFVLLRTDKFSETRRGNKNEGFGY
ncbi:hypothetical protein HDV05_000153 [Chytridiales sp. JEL 0842]|nr:hypothetical protein HDV05_000153 [Chytridiales sp. JEL 0842]